MTEYRYPLSNEWKDARERLSLLEAVRDPWTIRNLEKIGVRKGWRCLELGGGGGSMAQWLCRRVGESGHVIATDLQPHFLEAISASNLEVWRHDMRCDPLPDGAFDLVHARAVLAWLPRPADTITKMAAALKTGGWLLLEELDFVSARPDPSMGPAETALSIKGWNALRSHAQSCGYDLECARHLYHHLSKNGLGDLQAEGNVTIKVGGTPSARFWKISLEQVRDHMLTAGLLTLSELEDYRSLLDSPEYRWFSPIYMAAWGRCIATQ